VPQHTATFAYTHLITVPVHATTAAIAIYSGLHIAICDSLTESACQLLFSSMVCVVYVGLLVMAAVIADPFGDDIIDLPLAHYQEAMWRDQLCYDESRMPHKNVLRPIYQAQGRLSELDEAEELGPSE